MRKAILMLLVTLISLLLFASPALALKDPFRPIADSQSETGTTTEPGATVDEPTVIDTENPFSEGMPNTGADTASWMVLSYVLIVLGGAALALAWARRPTRA